MNEEYKKVIDFAEFGKRLLYVRENVLKMNQGELASKVGTSQALISRMENGIGGNINLIFDLVNFFYSKRINAEEIFSQHFDPNSLLGKEVAENHNNQQIEELVEEIKNTMNQDFEKLSLLLSIRG